MDAACTANETFEMLSLANQPCLIDDQVKSERGCDYPGRSDDGGGTEAGR